MKGFVNRWLHTLMGIAFGMAVMYHGAAWFRWVLIVAVWVFGGLAYISTREANSR